jgi:uncharacterized protein
MFRSLLTKMEITMANRFDSLTWEQMVESRPYRSAPRIADYHAVLSPEFPDFLVKYSELPILKRLAGISLLCGTDWTPLYHNRFYYSRLDHSRGVALIIWHFTHDKAQTLAGLLHDVSTPVFSHVIDFRNGDALTQESTENENAYMVRHDKALCTLLAEDGVTPAQAADYHQYPVADNNIPQLSADRLEYMFPSGMVLEGSWTLEDIRHTYLDIVLCRNEQGKPEPGFCTRKTAENYCRSFCNTGHVLQLNENKLTLQLLAEIINQAVNEGIITEKDCYSFSEQQIIDRFEQAATTDCTGTEFASYFRTFRTMKHIEHTDTPLPGCYCVSLKVKQRYIDPLVVSDGISKNNGLYPARRLSSVSPSAAGIISDFKSYSDTPYGCVRLQQPL